MPDITTPQVVKFANEKARLLADAAEVLYQTSKRFQQEWTALTASFPVGSTASNIADGSDADGRLRLTDTQLNGLKSLADAMVTWFETGSPTRIAQLQLIAVNGAAKF